MKKAIGFILAFILTIGIAFGAQQVISSRDAAPKPTTSKQVTSSSSSSTSSSHLKQPSHQQKAKGASKAKPKADRRAQKTANKPQTASSQSSTSPNRTTGSSAKASPNKVAKTKRSKASPNKVAKTKRSNAPKSDKLGKINHKAETKVVQDTHHAAKKSSNAKNTIQIHLTVDGYKKVFYSKRMRVKKGANAFSILKQTNLKISYIPGPSVYVNGINGLKENDVKAGSGWMFSVNKKFIDHAANLTKLKSGDNVRWYFTTEGY
ncbi:DUF4430 domain-containing protein [Lentilactobacillus hilgardii]|uniref:Transcobalamin-like C-terminal domain-containing protein n=1 Tax=Lentilactobacillus hilgardii (strain ATCC 8290 / DSM 20176 / CCUG 30140 / JCM 1155 / KCTC 3500 / NBRC 15886 / NCIMB 8040 / NRRL B-1843 / 9) TaxID=1423757 RepID=C0XKV8_LENH9|nr:DUF4430 domain-containing protein [Lentilactobacillus hilgardii]EEI23980.1 hypothetical protein HMPREF0519_1869 [Lentilactobacillus hilgardii DSM 20176 = ATCC 8290]TDG81067.1 hypothetical protein C5L34_001578 [Lentilactobacillus hilgardii]